MDFTRYRISIIARIIFILAVSFGAFYIMFRTEYWTLSLWLFVIIIYLTFNLIRLLEKSRRQLYRFVSSIRSNDFSPTYFLGSGSDPDSEMNRVYNEISEVFRSLRDDKEFHYQYLHLLIEHIDIAIVCFTDEFEVQFSNQAAYDLFGKPYFHNISSFERIDPEIGEAIRKVKQGDNQLLKVALRDELCSLTVSSAEFIFHEREYKLVTFYNIKPELERQELESWKQLIRTITHEVNNSAIPITNLTHFVSQTIADEDGRFKDLGLLSTDQKDDLRTSLLTIEKRSDGLVNFINSTRSFTKKQKPEFQKENVRELICRVLKLLSSDLDASVIKAECEVIPGTLFFTVDPALFEQVVINLVLNSMEALVNVTEPKIIIRCSLVKRRVVKITVSDNGRGINPEEMNNIFVPYYTTKTKGTGLGLSICRNIIDLHKGQISVKSELGKGTVFTILI
jgi:nitrogen fixation/metabolism regulation signal transduction histidine kinase